MFAFLSATAWRAAWSLAKKALASRVAGAGAGGQAVAIGLGALVVIVAGVGLVHWLMPSAPAPKQTAADVVIAEQAVTIEVHQAALERARLAEANAAKLREDLEVAQNAARAASAEISALVERPGNRMRCIDDVVLGKLRAKIQGGH